MSEALPLFDAMDKEAGKRKKKEGMDTAASHKSALLQEVRAAMHKLALSRPERTADADDASDWLIANGRGESALGPASGSLFKDANWVFTGIWVNSRKISNHSRMIRVWRLK